MDLAIRLHKRSPPIQFPSNETCLGECLGEMAMEISYILSNKILECERMLRSGVYRYQYLIMRTITEVITHTLLLWKRMEEARLRGESFGSIWFHVRKYHLKYVCFEGSIGEAWKNTERFALYFIGIWKEQIKMRHCIIPSFI